MKKYYLDIDLEELSNIGSLDIKEIHKKKFKKYLTELYLRIDSHSIGKLSRNLMYQCFTSNYYKKLHSNPNSVEYNLFNTLTTRVHLGSNLTKTISQYKLNIDLDTYLDNNNTLLVPYEVKKSTKKNIINYITIDKNHLIKTIEELSINPSKEQKREILQYRILLASLNKDTNKLTLEYDIKPAGRLYNQYSHLKKEIRNNLLHGYIEYDISTASYQFLYDFAAQIKKDLEAPLIQEYLSNKKAIRYKLAKELDTSYEVIKEILTAMGFGAKDKESYFEYYDDEILEVIKEPLNAIEKILYENNIPQEKWNNSIEIQKFISEIKILKNLVAKYIKENYYNPKTKTLNINNKKKVFEKQFRSSQALSFLYQHYESNFLLSMVKTYKKYTKNKDYFMLHDALIVKKDIDIKILEASKQTLDFKINWKLEREVI